MKLEDRKEEKAEMERMENLVETDETRTHMVPTAEDQKMVLV